jgi:predicted transcriptional regulator
VLYEWLEQLGFSKKESDVYIAVLQNGKISVADVAQLTTINRTTVYSVAKELIRRKIIREDVTASKTYLLARPPEDLHLLVERQKQNLNKQEHLIRKAIGELESLARNKRYSIPKIVFIDESELNEYLYSESPKWAQSIRQTDNVWWGFQDHSFVEHYEQWINWYWRHSSYKQVPLRLLTNESAIEEQMKQKQYTERQMKFLKNQSQFSATTWVNGDYLVMITTKTRPHYLVEIHDTILAANMREVFRALWERT